MTGGRWAHLDGAIPAFVTPGCSNPLDSPRARTEQAPIRIVLGTGPGFKTEGPPRLVATLPARATVPSPQVLNKCPLLRGHPNTQTLLVLHFPHCTTNHIRDPKPPSPRRRAETLCSLMHQGPRWISHGEHSTTFTGQTAAAITSAQWPCSCLILLGCRWRYPSSQIPRHPPP